MKYQKYRHVDAYLFRAGDVVLHGKGDRGYYFTVVGVDGPLYMTTTPLVGEEEVFLPPNGETQEMTQMKVFTSK